MCILLANLDWDQLALRLPLGSQGWYWPKPGFTKSTKCSSETGIQPIPPKRPLGVPPIPTKWHLKGSAAPSKSAPKGSAGPLKTAASKDDSSSSRCSPTKVRVDGVLVDIKGFSHPRRSAPSSRPQVPPKPKVPDRQSEAERNLVLSNQYFTLSDDKMESSSIL